MDKEAEIDNDFEDQADTRNFFMAEDSKQNNQTSYKYVGYQTNRSQYVLESQ